MNSYLRRIIKKVFNNFGFEITRIVDGTPINLNSFLELILVTLGQINIVQVGANDGLYGDPLHDFLMANKKHTKALLIEPQKSIIKYLEKNYESHPNISIFNGAIGSQQVITLYGIKPNLWSHFVTPYLKDAPAYRAPTGLTSANKNHVIKGIKKYLKSNITPEEAIETLEVPCKRLAEVLSLMGFAKNIHFLQVDVEGMDDEVIYASSIEEIRPMAICFESKNLTNVQIENLEMFLLENNYKIYQLNDSDMLAIRQLERDDESLFSNDRQI